MGADVFYEVYPGKNANEAFASAVHDAKYDHGHAGYTGSIAEKDDFVMVSKQVFDSRSDAADYANKLIEEGDPRIDDKWGPAGCVSFKQNDKIMYMFFGWASS